MRKELNIGEKAGIAVVVLATAFGLELGLAPKVFAEENLKVEGAEQIITLDSAEAQIFPDVLPSNPYFEAINGISMVGIISGFDDGTFGSDELISRQQFAKMIDETIGLNVTEDLWQDNEPLFDDLGPDDLASIYPHEYVAVAALEGITKGKNPGVFDPLGNITRAQVDTMIVRAAQNLQPGFLLEPPNYYKSTLGNFSLDHGEAFRWAEYNKLLVNLVDYNNSWDPNRPATRGEVAQILWNFINYDGNPIQITPVENEVNKNYHAPILAYHAVDTSPLPGEWGKALTVSTEQFKSEMDYLKRNGYHPVTMTQIYESMMSESTLPTKPVVITFDDGYLDQYTQAFPILQNYGFKATFFIITNAVGNSGYVNWDQLREMQDAGMDIESHTVSHPDLTTLDNNALDFELVESKRILEENLSKQILALSYMGGRYNGTVIEAAKNAGYMMAVTCKEGKNFSTSQRFELPRMSVARGESISSFAEDVK